VSFSQADVSNKPQKENRRSPSVSGTSAAAAVFLTYFCSGKMIFSEISA